MKNDKIIGLLIITVIYEAVGQHFNLYSIGTKDYCERENFETFCKDGEIVIMQTALYGIMELGKCIQMDYGYLGCQANVLDELDRICTGSDKCKFPVTDLREVGSACPPSLISYLKASYSCQAVTSCSKAQCTPNHFVNVIANEGYLSSAVTSQTGCGSVNCPWLIEALPGQKINFTVHSFSTQRPSMDLNKPKLCHKFASIRSSDPTKDFVSCDHAFRSVENYISQSHRAEISMKIGAHERANSNLASIDERANVNDAHFVRFLIHYKVIGCPTIKAPQHGFITLQTENSVVVKCNYSEEFWKLRCLGTSWSSEITSCPSGSIWQWNEVDNTTTNPHGMLIIIAIGIALGIAAGFLMLGLAVIYFKRRHIFHGQGIPIPQCDMAEGPEKLMTGYSHEPSSLPIGKHDALARTGSNTVCHPYVERGTGGVIKPIIPEYNVLTQDQTYPFQQTEKPCSYIYQGGNSYGGNFSPVQHLYESPTFERKNFHSVNNVQQLNPADFNGSRNNNDVHPGVHST